ncbi:hypothetical protein [Bounagaea algeriensis]
MFTEQAADPVAADPVAADQALMIRSTDTVGHRETAEPDVASVMRVSGTPGEDAAGPIWGGPIWPDRSGRCGLGGANRAARHG